MLGRGVGDVIRSHPPEWLWGDTLEVLKDSDLRVANLECCISHRGEAWSSTPKVFHFRAPPQAARVLRAASIDVVSLANNHSLDYGYEALLDTLEALDAAEIAAGGAGTDVEEAAQPTICETRAGEPLLALLAWTDNEPPFAAQPDRPGTNFLEVGDDTLIERIPAGRERAPIVCVSAHWGPNMSERPPKAHRNYARRAVEAGCTIWHGHSAHIPQGVEFIPGPDGWGAVLYDTGDVIDDYVVDPNLRNDRSLVFTVDVEQGLGVRRIEARPLKISYGRVDLAHGDDYDWMARRFIRLCGELGTDAHDTGEAVVLEPSS